jgi:dCMP deaminase
MSQQRPSRDSILISNATLWALRSTCSRAQVGVVIATSDYRTLANGYNGAPAGMPHCDHACKCALLVLNDPLGIHSSRCPAYNPCKVSVHGEANAIAYAARNGVAIGQSQLFTTVAPCYPCSQLIINAGIVRVIFAALHRDMSGVELLRHARVEVVQYEHEEEG